MSYQSMTEAPGIARCQLMVRTSFSYKRRLSPMPVLAACLEIQEVLKDIDFILYACSSEDLTEQLLKLIAVHAGEPADIVRST